MFRKCLFFLAALLIPTSLQAYEPTLGIRWDSCTSQTKNEFTAHNGVTVKYSYKYCSSLKESNIQNIHAVMSRVNLEIQLYAKKLKLPVYSCLENDNLDIYEVSLAVLNDPSRFKVKRAPDIKLLGYYDPMLTDTGKSTIAFASFGYPEDELTIAHEMAHYWYDRFCWNLMYSDTEGFARDFEKYYKDRRFGD